MLPCDHKLILLPQLSLGSLEKHHPSLGLLHLTCICPKSSGSQRFFSIEEIVNCLPYAYIMKVGIKSSVFKDYPVSVFP